MPKIFASERMLMTVGCPGNITVSNRQQLKDLAACNIVNGDVRISRIPAADIGDTAPYTLNLSSLTTVYGNLEIVDVAFDRADDEDLIIDAPNLSNIAGTLSFSQMQNLAMPKFGALNVAIEIAFDKITFAGPAEFGSATFWNLASVNHISLLNTGVTTVGSGWTSRLSGVVNTQDELSITLGGNENLSNVTLHGWDDRPVNIDIQGNLASPSVNFPDITQCLRLNLETVRSFNASNLQTIGRQDTLSLPQTKTSDWNVRRQESEDPISSPSSVKENSFIDLTLEALATIYGPFELSDNANLERIYFSALSNVFGDVSISGEALDL